MRRFIWTVGAVLFLASCSGEGGGVPTVYPNSTRSLTGLERPSFTDAESARRSRGTPGTIVAVTSTLAELKELAEEGKAILDMLPSTLHGISQL